MHETSLPSRARRGRLLTGLLVSSLLVGCLPGNLPNATTGKRPVPKASASIAPSSAPTITPSVAPSTGVTPGGGIIANNGSSLSGVVRVPAGLISNNGGSVVSNGGGNWRVLAAVPESPLAGVTVRLVDAKGDPLKDASGLALTATTDAEGRYGFTAALPAQQILIEVALPESKGQLKALATYGSGVKKADVGLVSTLTTTYILEKYIKDLPDPVTRLERLPASMEAETRTKAQAAFDGGTAAVPPALTAEAVVATVEQLRQQSTAFNQQLEAVKQVLVVAGQSDLGSGRPGTEVDIRNIGELVPAPGGALYLSAPFDRRVWKLRSDGILETAIGKGGTAISPTVAGLSGRDAGLGAIRHMALDAKGRVLVVDDAFSPSRGNVFRLDTNGKLDVLWKGPDAARFAFPAGDDVLVFTTTDPLADEMTAKLWRLTPGQAPREVASYTDKEPIYLNNAESAGLDATGQIWIATQWMDDVVDETRLLKVDPTTGAMQIADRAAAGVRLFLDSRGQTFRPNAGSTHVTAKAPDGTSRTIALPLSARLNLENFALGVDEALYVAGSGKVVRVGADGKVTRLVGATASTDGTTDANSIAVLAVGLATDSQGVLYASELKSNRVLKIQNGQLATVYTAPNGDTPWTLRFDTQGKLHALIAPDIAPPRLVRLDGAQAVPVHTWSAAEGAFPIEVDDFVIGKDGAVYASYTQDVAVDPPTTDEDGDVVDRVKHSWVKRLPLNGFTELEVDHGVNVWGAPALAIAPDGALYLGGGSGVMRLRRWLGGTMTTLMETDDSELILDISGLALDAQGRLYVTSTFANRLYRFEAATKALTILAGPGGKLLSGSGVDDSLEYPGHPTFDKDGNLYVTDEIHKQIKRLPANQL